MEVRWFGAPDDPGPNSGASYQPYIAGCKFVQRVIAHAREAKPVPPAAEIVAQIDHQVPEFRHALPLAAKLALAAATLDRMHPAGTAP
jgi:hypothetical protein